VRHSELRLSSFQSVGKDNLETQDICLHVFVRVVMASQPLLFFPIRVDSPLSSDCGSQQHLQGLTLRHYERAARGSQKKALLSSPPRCLIQAPKSHSTNAVPLPTRFLITCLKQMDSVTTMFSPVHVLITGPSCPF
jgi:hypothetical protein